MKRVYYYHQTTDDVVDSHNQNFSLPDDYEILANSRIAKIWSGLARYLAAGFGWIVFRLFDHVKVIGKEKLKQVDGGYFIYGNHTRPMGDVFTSLTIFPIKNFYAIANQANWGIPFIGKYLVRYGGLPVGKDVKQLIKLIETIQTVIKDKKGEILIYPEAHVWPYYTKIRTFDSTSMHFPVKLNAPSFVMTKTYHKRRLGRRPRCVIYIDGPFYPDRSLNRKEAQNKLHDVIWKTMNERAQLSDYEYYQYRKE
ncbi:MULTISPECIES: 1-acyl-sn-glycerol-3-phosphate acyltransferase [Lactobacillus]|uniref:1-acyl-sn-glycerol-3-phosphate acyltransferase n=1 Tax=Lactobacillus xujianguonis TaxID=2495899 RepID=A0A437SVZ1_9LACO|nr:MULTISPECIES: 1-acyl-sn-glycerol-3-phosphate acyltransferase [Lactobacillus]RVU71096.1 1-acyl-sn-glycerol-3-phosphate acyltransferase [Lactobacillus xujianguonis]RVU76748.1 1-acyl-sn-glycerol-3-phosphate acyltransferase [Lactobacillus xujianguonis]